MKKDNKEKDEKFGPIEGVIETIYVDFDTIENIQKQYSVVFSLVKDNKKAIVVYDKNAYELGLIKVGVNITCMGSYQGKISVIDSKGQVIEDDMFLCLVIMGDADIDEGLLKKLGGKRLR